MRVPAGWDAGAARVARPEQRPGPAAPRSSIRNAHSIHQRSRKRLSQDTYRRNSVRYLQQRRRPGRPGPQSAASPHGERGQPPGAGGGASRGGAWRRGRGQGWDQGRGVRVLSGLEAGLPGRRGPGWGLEGGAGPLTGPPNSTAFRRRGAAGERARKATARSAPASQRKPHPAPLQREHQEEAGVARLRPGGFPEVVSWLLRPAPPPPCIHLYRPRSLDASGSPAPSG